MEPTTVMMDEDRYWRLVAITSSDRLMAMQYRFIMKTCLLLLAICLPGFATYGQTGPTPPGSSKFIRELAGLYPDEGKVDVVGEIAGDNFDAIEGGGGPEDWVEVDGRVFLTRRWMIEIGKMTEGYSTFDFNRKLAAEIQRRLEAEGFKLTPPKFNLHSIRYQKGTTVGTIEIRSFFLSSGNLPLRMEFIFNESYLRTTSVRKKG